MAIRSKDSFSTSGVDSSSKGRSAPGGSVPLGKLYREAKEKDHGKIELRELEREFNSDYMENLREAAQLGKRIHPGIEKIYVVVLMKRERLMHGVLRNYFFTRITCPSPSHDITVYSFNTKTEDLQFLWLLPSKELCQKIYENRYIAPNAVTPYVVEFMEGRLSKKIIKLNKSAERNL